MHGSIKTTQWPIICLPMIITSEIFTLFYYSFTNFVNFLSAVVFVIGVEICSIVQIELFVLGRQLFDLVYEKMQMWTNVTNCIFSKIKKQRQSNCR